MAASTTTVIRRRIVETLRAVPAGTVATYGQIAQVAGWPRHTRLVVRVLREAAEGNVPWFRIVKSPGKIALPKGSASRREQIQRLRSEGVLVNGDRIDLDRFGWRPELDELLFRAPD